MNDQLITDHVVEPYQLGTLVICIYLDGTRPCGRPEHEHAPAVSSSTAGA